MSVLHYATYETSHISKTLSYVKKKQHSIWHYLGLQSTFLLYFFRLGRGFYLNYVTILKNNTYPKDKLKEKEKELPTLLCQLD